jgi:hypothetical protein
MMHDDEGDDEVAGAQIEVVLLLLEIIHAVTRYSARGIWYEEMLVEALAQQ